MNVVSALIVNEGRMLLTKRGDDVLRPSMWEHPGGKIEEGEEPEAALVRELQEELGVEANIGQVISKSCIPFEVSVNITLYEVSIIGEPTPKVADDIGWFDLDCAIKHLPLMPSVYLWSEDIRKYMG